MRKKKVNLRDDGEKKNKVGRRLPSFFACKGLRVTVSRG